MRRIILFLLAFQLLSGNLLGAELMKMPFLARHFQAHRSCNPGDTLLEFLVLHYTGTRHRDADASHRQLPLHAISAGSVTAMLLPVPVEEKVIKRPSLFMPPMPAYESPFVSDGFRTRLLRPPR